MREIVGSGALGTLEVVMPMTRLLPQVLGMKLRRQLRINAYDVGPEL